ncbi:MAG: hypothetical protein LBC73_05650 [Oscillospiraceae bacterium]|jgi:hypothetical protein|nr:hypothetical protein [Oscillospiraceae bacterium]
MNDEAMLAMKITSARPEPAYDKSDSLYYMKALQIESIEQINDIVDKYIDPILITLEIEYHIEDIFNEYQKTYNNVVVVIDNKENY